MFKYILILLLISISCTGQVEKNNKADKTKSEYTKTDDYTLVKAKNQKGLLILFPCFPCDAQNTFNEFNIVASTIENGISVLAMNLNQRLYLSEYEKADLAALLEKIIQQENLTQKNIVVGGFSSGGNVSMLISNYLIKNNSEIKIKGVFIVDSPIDLLGLYRNAEENIKLNFSKPAIQEATWIKNLFDNEFGKPLDGISKYEIHSPYTFQTQNIENLKHLENIKIRLYTEPDLKWWKESRNRDYEYLNAFYLEKLYGKLIKEFGNKNVEFITTENRGYRANGERHPHSWSIVDEKDIVNWMNK